MSNDTTEKGTQSPAAPCSAAGNYFPRTRRGWKALFWLSVGRCPLCHGALLRDWPLYDDGVTVYCMPCGGAMFPNGLLATLRMNKRATKTQNTGA